MNSPRAIATAIILTLFAAAAVCYLTGCAKPLISGHQTAALSGHLADAERANTAARSDAIFLRENLSRADGKADVILEWFRQHRGTPEH